jgi:DNA-binding response OmpR family regulator
MIPPAIVLIEKDEVTLEIYQRELCNNFRLYCFTELCEISDIFEQEDIQAIVVEPEISNGQGWDWINSIQEMTKQRNISIIVCSTRDLSLKSSGCQVDLYLTKPVLPKTLHKKIHALLTDKKKWGHHE